MRTVMLFTAILVAALIPTVAPAGDNPGVIKTGKCSNGASWKLKAKHEEARIEVEFEVDQNVSGRRWNVVLRHNKIVFFRGARITRPPSGSFEINRRVGNRAGRTASSPTPRLQPAAPAVRRSWSRPAHGRVARALARAARP